MYADNELVILTAGMSTGMGVVILIGVFGLLHLFCAEGIMNWKKNWPLSLFNILIYNNLPEKWCIWFERITGIILIFCALIVGVGVAAASKKQAEIEFHDAVYEAFEEKNTPYELDFQDKYVAEVYLSDESSDEFMVKDIHEKDTDPPAEVADYLISEADIFFKRTRETNVVSNDMRMNPMLMLSNPNPSNPAPETLETADNLIQEAGVKWQSGDLNGSIQLAEKALQIKARILGDDHVKVLELKNQLQQAKTQALQMQIKPQQNP